MEYDIQEANWVQVSRELSCKGKVFLQRTGAPYSYAYSHVYSLILYMARWISLGQQSEPPCPIQAICFEYAVDMHRELVATSASERGIPGTTCLRDWTWMDDLAAWSCGEIFWAFHPEDFISIVGTFGGMPHNVAWNVLYYTVIIMSLVRCFGPVFSWSQTASRRRALLACSVAIPTHAQVSCRRTGGQTDFYWHTVDKRAKVRMYGDTVLTPCNQELYRQSADTIIFAYSGSCNKLIQNHVR